MERLAGKVVLLWGWRRALVAFVAGVLAVGGQAPYDFPAACFVAFPLLVWLLDGAVAAPSAGFLARSRPAFAIGWWFGFGYFLAGLWWVGNALLVEAESFAWALPLAVLALPAGLAVFYGLATSIARLLWSDGIGRIAALAAAFGVAEWLRAVVLTGFPWNAIGYAAMPVPVLMQSVEIVGLYGMNALAVFVFALPALLAARLHRTLGLVLGVAVVATHGGYGLWRLGQPAENARPLSVRIVQPSIDQAQKWDPEARDRTFRTLLDLTTEQPSRPGFRPTVIVWPETSVPFILTSRPDALAALGEAIDDGQRLLAGVVRSEGPADQPASARYYNSIVAIDSDGQIEGAFDKVHLVPFGEYLPFESLLGSIGLSKVVALPESFSEGTSRTPLSLPGDVRALPLICYEAIFPGDASGGAADANLMLNVTNDAWFGDTPGPYQHVRQAQVRAVETGLPLVRAANNGISAVVAPDGQVVDALELDAVGVLDAEVMVGRRAPPLDYRTLCGLLIMGFLATFACVMLATGRSRTN